eukprot:12186757-Alexandrium_andersonii.AAC.1
MQRGTARFIPLHAHDLATAVPRAWRRFLEDGRRSWVQLPGMQVGAELLMMAMTMMTVMTPTMTTTTVV